VIHNTNNVLNGAPSFPIPLGFIFSILNYILRVLLSDEEIWGRGMMPMMNL
jgi:hypothetical protein